jgi:hypothetical protein
LSKDVTGSHTFWSLVSPYLIMGRIMTDQSNLYWRPCRYPLTKMGTLEGVAPAKPRCSPLYDGTCAARPTAAEYNTSLPGFPKRFGSGNR